MRSWGKSSAGNSGQLLVVAALIIAILISSTTMYVYNLDSQDAEADNDRSGDYLLVFKQASRNVLISSLSNISKGGETSVLATNLLALSGVLRKMQTSLVNLSFVLPSESSYESGVQISWNSSEGFSTVYVHFGLEITGTYDVSSEYDVNVTTSLAVNCSVTTSAEGEKLIDLTCNLFNEDKPVLLKTISISYGTGENLSQADIQNGLAIWDKGDGSYDIRFVVPNQTEIVVVRALDPRDIYVQSEVDVTSPTP